MILGKFGVALAVLLHVFQGNVTKALTVQFTLRELYLINLSFIYTLQI